jgi:nitrile hydratase
MSDAPPPHHTRLPGYVMGKVGVVERLHGVHVFADSHAHGKGEDPHWLYTVAFAAADLWPVADDTGGSAAGGEGPVNQRFTVSVDAWEPYLKPEDGDGIGRWRSRT